VRLLKVKHKSYCLLPFLLYGLSTSVDSFFDNNTEPRVQYTVNELSIYLMNEKRCRFTFSDFCHNWTLWHDQSREESVSYGHARTQRSDTRKLQKARKAKGKGLTLEVYFLSEKTTSSAVAEYHWTAWLFILLCDVKIDHVLSIKMKVYLIWFYS